MEGVEEDPEGQREQPLRDPLGEPAWCSCEVPLEPHLFFQVREDALDRQSQSGESAFAVVVGCGSFAGGVSSCTSAHSIRSL